MEKYKNLLSFILIIFSIISCEFLGIDETNDYFPINLANSWTYSFKYKPISWEDEEFNGKLTWEIIDIQYNNQRKVTILETVVGIRINYNWNTETRDSSEFSQSNSIYFKQTDNFIELLKPNFFNRIFKFKSKYETDEDYITVRDDYEHENSENVISLDGEWDIIGLRKNIGIEEWTIRASHNSGPYGQLFLTNYRIIPSL